MPILESYVLRLLVCMGKWANGAPYEAWDRAPSAGRAPELGQEVATVVPVLHAVIDRQFHETDRCLSGLNNT